MLVPAKSPMKFLNLILIGIGNDLVCVKELVKDFVRYSGRGASMLLVIGHHIIIWTMCHVGLWVGEVFIIIVGIL